MQGATLSTKGERDRNQHMVAGEDGGDNRGDVTRTGKEGDKPKKKKDTPLKK